MGLLLTPPSGTIGVVSNIPAPKGVKAEAANPPIPISKADILDAAGLFLDLLGMIPGIGNIASVANTGLSAYRGDWFGAAANAFGITPGAGNASKVAKVMSNLPKVQKAINTLNRALPSMSIPQGAKDALKDALDAAQKYLNKLMGKADDIPGAKSNVVPSPKPDSGGPAPGGKIKPDSLRNQYLGRTPGKGSKTGREVQDRMRKDGELRDTQEGIEFKAKDGEWHPLKDADMAHTQDAVKWWNETGRELGPKSEGVRNWMLDSKNYKLEHYSINRSEGALLSDRYLPPLK